MLITCQALFYTKLFHLTHIIRHRSYEMGELEFEPRPFAFRILALDCFLGGSIDLLCTSPKVKFSALWAIQFLLKLLNLLYRVKVVILTMLTTGCDGVPKNPLKK